MNCSYLFTYLCQLIDHAKPSDSLPDLVDRANTNANDRPANPNVPSMGHSDGFVTDIGPYWLRQRLLRIAVLNLKLEEMKKNQIRWLEPLPRLINCFQRCSCDVSRRFCDVFAMFSCDVFFFVFFRSSHFFMYKITFFLKFITGSQNE